MKTLTKTLIASAAFAAIATSAFSQVAWEFNPGMAYMYSGAGQKMTAMTMAANEKSHATMMKHATRCPATRSSSWTTASSIRCRARSTPPVISIGPDPSQARMSPLRAASADRYIDAIRRSKT